MSNNYETILLPFNPNDSLNISFVYTWLPSDTKKKFKQITKKLVLDYRVIKWDKKNTLAGFGTMLRAKFLDNGFLKLLSNEVSFLKIQIYRRKNLEVEGLTYEYILSNVHGALTFKSNANSSFSFELQSLNELTPNLVTLFSVPAELGADVYKSIPSLVRGGELDNSTNLTVIINNAVNNLERLMLAPVVNKEANPELSMQFYIPNLEGREPSQIISVISRGFLNKKLRLAQEKRTPEKNILLTEKRKISKILAQNKVKESLDKEALKKEALKKETIKNAPASKKAQAVKRARLRLKAALLDAEN